MLFDIESFDYSYFNEGSEGLKLALVQQWVAARVQRWHEQTEGEEEKQDRVTETDEGETET